MIWYLVLLALSIVGASWLFGRSPGNARRGTSAWRWIPLLAGVLLVPVTAATFGAGILLAPIPLVLTVLVLRRVEPGGAALWVGATLNIGWMALFAITVAMVVHEVAVG